MDSLAKMKTEVFMEKPTYPSFLFLSPQG